MLNPSTIDPLALPFVALDQRSQLPATPCVYLAINSEGKVQYIGRSSNPRKRWQSHHKGIELALIGGIRIAYIESDPDLLPEIERALIAYFHPPLNRLVCDEPPVKCAMRTTSMQIERVIRIKAPGMGARIKQARERDPRSVEELARAADMTRANWYRIEREENDVLPEPTLRKIEEVLGVDFGVKFDA